jgi:hypothetical protein
MMAPIGLAGWLDQGSLAKYVWIIYFSVPFLIHMAVLESMWLLIIYMFEYPYILLSCFLFHRT